MNWEEKKVRCRHITFRETCRCLLWHPPAWPTWSTYLPGNFHFYIWSSNIISPSTVHPPRSEPPYSFLQENIQPLRHWLHSQSVTTLYLHVLFYLTYTQWFSNSNTTAQSLFSTTYLFSPCKLSNLEESTLLTPSLKLLNTSGENYTTLWLVGITNLTWQVQQAFDLISFLSHSPQQWF